MIKIKRIYNPASKDEGKRILVDRLWPRGLKKEKAMIDEWLKDIAPSDELRRWFSHESSKWQEFRRRYRGELRKNSPYRKAYNESNFHCLFYPDPFSLHY